MKKIGKVFLLLVSPFLVVLRALWELLRSLLRMIAEVPAEIAKVFSVRMEIKAEQLSFKLDNGSKKKQQRINEKELRKAVNDLFACDNLFQNMYLAKAIKLFLIVALQAVSFHTTLRGLYQCFATLSPFIPLLLALVIQIGLTYLATSIGYDHSPKGHRYLTVLFLVTSICFSFAGISESLIPYTDHVKTQYTAFLNSYTAVYAQADDQTESSSNPNAEIKAAFSQITNLLMEADERYGDEQLKSARKKLAYYENLKTDVVIELPSSTFINPDGSESTNSGGNQIVPVDTEGKLELIKSAQDEVQFILEIQSLANTIQTLLDTENEETILRIIDTQTSVEEDVSENLVLANANLQLIISKSEVLAQKMGSPFSVKLDLIQLVNSHHKHLEINSLTELPTFESIQQAWQNEELNIPKTGEAQVDRLLTTVLQNNPTRLKELADQQVFDAYQALSKTLSSHQKASLALDTAYTNYHTLAPLNYAIDNLYVANPNFKAAVLALIIAIFNDGIAVLIGLWITHSKVRFDTNGNLSRSDIMAHVYKQFQLVVTPIIRNRLHGPVSLETVSNTFLDILQDYMSHFRLSGQLVQEGYSRYFTGSVPSQDFESISAFLLTSGFIKSVTPEIARDLGLISDLNQAQTGDQHLLLTNRGEGWIAGLMGNVAELKPETPEGDDNK